MNIISAIQKHYCKRSTLLIPSSIDSVRHNFAELATVGIVRGNRWNLFAPDYKLKVRWDGNSACLDGPYGKNMVPLTTQVTINPSASRDRTTLDIAMQLSIRYIYISLLITSLVAVFTLCLQLKSQDKLIIFLFWVMMSYGLNQRYLFNSIDIICKCLSEELSTIDRS